MLDKLIDFAVHRRAITLVATLVLAVFGVVTFTKLKIEAFPDVTNVQVMVITLYPGQAAEEIEKQVTIPVERALTGTPRVLIQRSITSFGLSQVVLTFEDDVDIYWARQQVSERLTDAEVPEGITPHLGPNDTPVGQVYQYTLESDRHSPSELRSWQDWVVSKNLMRAPGVADVVSFGGFQKEYHVLADPSRLRNAGITLKDVIDAVSESNAATSGGYLQLGESELVVRGRGYLKSPVDVGNTVVKATGGTPILVRNVAQVVEAYTPRRGAVARAGATDSVEGTVLLRRGENPKDVLRGLHEAVARINDEMLPPGMRIVPFYDRTRLVDTTLKTVSHNMIEGIVLVSIVVWMFLRAMIGSLAVSMVMPLALLTAFVGLYYAGVPANLLSMGAIDFGILLEGAVIVVENAYRHLAIEKPPPESVAHVVAESAKEVVRPTLFSMAIIGAAMMPIFTLERVEGRIFRPVALTYAFALGGALLFTLTAVPALTAALLKHRPVKEAHPPFLAWLQDRYLAGLRVTMRRPFLVALVAVAVIGGATALVPRLGSEFLPPMNEGDIHITVTMPSAVSLERGSEVLRDMRRALLKFPEVKDVLSEQGHPEDGTDDEAPNQSETFVIMKPESDWAEVNRPGQGEKGDKKKRTKDEIIEAMRVALDRPGRRLQLQPADQGPRRGVDLGHSRPGRREDLRHRSRPDAPAARRGQGDHRRHARRARRRHLPGRHRAAHRRRRRSRGDVPLRRLGARRRGRDRERLRRQAGDGDVGRGAQGRRARSRRRSPAKAIRRRSAGWRSRPSTRGCSSRRWRSCTSTAGARRSTASRASGSWPSSATSRAATWAASSPRRRRASRRR